MQKMLIRLNDEKIERDNEFDIKKMWDFIDGLFARFECIKDVNDNGEITYYGNPTHNNYLCEFGIVYNKLMDEKWFTDNCSKWVWYDNDRDESRPYHEMNVLQRMGLQ